MTAALASVEVKLGRQRQWHVHLHVLCDGRYIPQPRLKREWARITEDSCVVDVRAVHSRRDAARYVSKYISKVEGVESWTAAEVCEFAGAMHGRRTLSHYGRAKVVKEVDDTPEVPEPSTHVASAFAIERARELEVVRHALDVLSRVSYTACMVFRLPWRKGVPVDPRELKMAYAVLRHVDTVPCFDLDEAELDRLRAACLGELPSPCESQQAFQFTAHADESHAAYAWAGGRRQ